MVTQMNRNSIQTRRNQSTILRKAPRGRRAPFPIMVLLGYTGAFAAVVFWWWQSSIPTPEEMDAKASRPPVAALATPSILTNMKNEQKLLESVAFQANEGVRYSSKYYAIPYPNGDVPAEVGVSTDIVIRAFRSIGIDLQQAIHEDRVAFPEKYPLKRWANSRPDTNIDHRRVVNLAAYLENHGESHPLADWSSYRPGDIVFWRLASGEFPDHVGIVLDKKDRHGAPLVAELNARTRKLSTRTPITLWPIRNHYRLAPLKNTAF